MKRIAIVVAVIALLGFSATTFASSWDIVGKVLTGIEGARILTGGKLDVIGSVTGIGNNGRDVVVQERRTYVVEAPAPCSRVWVPAYTYVKVWVPAHTERDPRCGRVYISGHYETRKVENGGYWANSYPQQERHENFSRRGRR